MSEGMEHDGPPPSGTSLMVNVITVLAGLMLLLLLALPFLVQLQPTSDTIAYVVYAVFLISLSVTIGMGVAFRLFARLPPPSMSGIMVRDYGFLEPGSEGERWTRPGEAFAPSAPLGADASAGDEDDAPAPSDGSSTVSSTPLSDAPLSFDSFHSYRRSAAHAMTFPSRSITEKLPLLTSAMSASSVIRTVVPSRARGSRMDLMWIQSPGLAGRVPSYRSLLTIAPTPS